MASIGTALSNVLTWIGSTVTALFDSTGALNPLFDFFIISVAISIFLLGIRAIRSLVWGA